MPSKSGRAIQVTKFKAGNGEGTAFWRHSWCTDIPLSRLFPSLYSSSSSKKSSVVDNFMVSEGTQSDWFLGLSCETMEPQQPNIELLRGRIKNVQLNEEMDKLMWTDGSEQFSVRVCYQFILNLRLPVF